MTLREAIDLFYVLAKNNTSNPTTISPFLCNMWSYVRSDPTERTMTLFLDTLAIMQHSIATDYHEKYLPKYYVIDKVHMHESCNQAMVQLRWLRERLLKTNGNVDMPLPSNLILHS